MDTKLLYLDDTYLLKSKANIVDIAEDERGNYVILDQTIFYPQGGGQPSDTGLILNNDGNMCKIEFVKFFDGKVYHYIGNGKKSDITLRIGENVSLIVDEHLRMQFAKAHTAGHLIQAIVEKSSDKLKAVKGYHFLEGPYVQFTGEKPENTDEFIQKINDGLSLAINQAHSVTANLVNPNEIATLCPNLPYSLPEGKPLRTVVIEGLSNHVPCGGTHIRNLNEFKKMLITKLKMKKGEVVLSYSFE